MDFLEKKKSIKKSTLSGTDALAKHQRDTELDYLN